MRRFIAELRRRHVLRVGAVYLVVAWAMIEVSATTFPMIGLPDWAPTLVLALLAVGFVGSSRVDLQACKLEYSIVSPK